MSEGLGVIAACFIVILCLALLGQTCSNYIMALACGVCARRRRIHPPRAPQTAGGKRLVPSWGGGGQDSLNKTADNDLLPVQHGLALVEADLISALSFHKLGS